MYFPAVAPPLANAGDDERSTPAVAKTLAKAVRRSTGDDDELTSLVAAGRTE